MEKTLFKEYEEWCVKNNKDPLKEETVSEFNLLKKQEVEDKKSKDKEELVAKQKEIFEKMCEYVGVKAKYDESYMFNVFDGYFKSFVMASVITQKKVELDKIYDKVIK